MLPTCQDIRLLYITKITIIKLNYIISYVVNHIIINVKATFSGFEAIFIIINNNQYQNLDPDFIGI